MESVYTVTVRGLYAIIFMIICANRMHNRFFFSGAVHVLRAPRLGHVGIIPCISDNTHEQSVDLSDSKEKNNRFFTTQRGTFEKKNVAPGSHGFGVNWELFSVDREQRKK